MPVPVDDDTNDPQYIPRRGRFYEHDDRMAYSTSSEESETRDIYGVEFEEADEENALYAIILKTFYFIFFIKVLFVYF